MAKQRRTTGPNTPDLSYITEDLRPLAVPIETLTLDPENCRQHAERDLAAIAASLRKFGQRKPIVVNVKGGQVIEAGNGTVLAMQRNGWTHVAVVRVKDDPDSARGYAVADNRTAELSKWDEDRLLSAIAEITKSDEQLALELSLDELEAALKPVESPSMPQAAVGAPAPCGVLIECANKSEQRKLLKRLQGEGLKATAATL